MKLEICLALVALMVFSVGQALRHEVVSGFLHSAINLTTSFDLLCIKDISWSHIIHEKEYRIMKVRHGLLVDRLNSNYQPFHNGASLGINNLTAGGLYIADVTFLNNTSKKETFKVTLLRDANNQVHKPALLHGSVSLTNSASQKTGKVTLVSWKYKNVERITILDATEKPYFLYPSQFRDRLLISDDLFTLTIKDLTMEDNGMYSIEVTDRSGNTEYSIFNVTVYEPIPVPSIRTEVKVDITDRCNITLHCSVPSYTSHFSYTWKYRHPDSEYRMYNAGSSIQISVPPDQQDMELLCIVHNLVDQKNVSVQVQGICKISDNSSSPRSHLSIILIILIVIFILAIVSMMYISRRYRIKEVGEKSNREMNYIEVTTRPREDNPVIQMENDQYMGVPSPRQTKAETVYTTLQHPPTKHT